MLCDHYEDVEISSDVLNKYGNTLAFHENHF